MSNSRFVAWSVWLIASIFYAYQYILRVMPNIIMDDIMINFKVDATAFGQFSGVYYIGYSLMHLPIGIMLDRYGPRKVMTVCILLSVIGLLPIIYADNFIYPVIGRAIMGIGSSAAILGTFKIIRISFSEKLFPRMLSFSVTIGLIGAIYGGGPVSYMCEHLQYKTVIQIFAFMGVILALITYLIVPNIEVSKSDEVLSNIKYVLTNKKVILSCIFAGLMIGPIEGFADVWGARFLTNLYGIDGELAASYTSMIFVGMCFGAPVLTFIAEKTGNYIVSIIGAGFFMMLIFALLISNLLSHKMIVISFTMVGVCCAYQILAIYKASTYVEEKVVGLTTAVANMIIMSFGYAFHSAIGKIIDIYGGAKDVNAFTKGISIIPICLAIGVLGFIGLYIEEQRRLKFIENKLQSN